MSYVALYRKFRPRTFDQVKGQDHIVRTLKNQIKNQRIGHAYLFTGTRGTGKTSVAKILAKAVNCLHPVDGEPCDQCENCLAANQGNFMDIVEIDAASNTGVEDIRRVIEEIQYTPARGKYKVYIIDEVHMLSVNAFNAFLKTLEEPPEYVVFVLATTEPHKLPATILSRCQRYDFKRIDLDTIEANLADLLQAEGVEAEEKALRYIARAGDGSMRDALSLMDRCVAFSLGEKITYENVLSILGTVDTEDFSALYRAISSYNIVDALKIIEKTVDSGRDLSPFINDFIMYLRNLLILNVGGKSGTELLGLSEENIKLLEEDVKTADSEVLMRYIRILSELLNQIRFSAAKQILVEVAMIKLARPEMETSEDAILDRIRKLEERPQPSASPAEFAAAPEDPFAAAPEPPHDPDIIDMGRDEYEYEVPMPEDMQDHYPEEAVNEAEPEEEPDLPGQQTWGMPQPAAAETPVNAPAPQEAAAGGDSKIVASRWAEVLAACDDRRLKTFLNKTQTGALEGDGFAIYAEGSIAYKQLNDQAVKEYLKQLILDTLGIEVTLSVLHMDSKPEIPEQQDLGALLKNINMNIETEEV